MKRIVCLLIAVVLSMALIGCAASGDKEPAGASSAIASSVESVKDSKIAITVTVKFADKTEKEYAIKTEEKYLRGALEQENLVEGTESEYGLFVQKVAGVAAEEGYYWAFYQDGEYMMTGVDSSEIHDGDTFQIVYEKIEY